SGPPPNFGVARSHRPEPVHFEVVSGGGAYRFRLTRSWSISSLAVMIREFAWKPRWAMIRLVNSWARSTFDISSVPAAIDPRPAVPGVPTSACPEAPDARKRLWPALTRPAGLLKAPRAMRASGWLRPLEKTPETT